MATRGAKVKPEDVTDVNTWVYNYKKGRVNVVLGENGEFLVLDPTLMRQSKADALAAPAKIIPHERGYDAYALVDSANAELRASALAKLDSVRNAIYAQAEEASTEFQDIESEYLAAVDAWNAAPTGANANTVGTLQRRLAAADTKFRHALYPHRYIETHDDIQRRTIDYASKDDRKLKHILFQTIYESSVPSERIVTVVDKA